MGGKVGRGSNAYANCTNGTKRREDEHHDHLLTKKKTINTQNALGTPWEEF